MPRILVVDDDRSMTALLKTLLEMEPEGFQVEVSSTGSGVVDLAYANPPDLFMVDYNLKDMAGVELIQHLRQHTDFSTTPIVMASGLNVEKEAYAAGANLFLLKPFEPSEIAGIFLDLIG